MPEETPNTKAMASPPKAETPRKRQADNPSDNVQTSRPRRMVKAPVKYAYQ